MKKKVRVFKPVFGIMLCVYTLLLASLLFYAFYTSCKDMQEFTYNTWKLPQTYRFENYLFILKEFKQGNGITSPLYYLEDMLTMSFVYAFLCATATVTATFLMAYACSQFKCKVSNMIYFLVMFMIVVPIIGAYPAEYRMITSLKLENKLFGAFFLKFNFGSIYFLLLYETLKGIPNDYREAAQMDGASQLRVMLLIIFPMSFNICGSIFLVQFVSFWNDYQTPLLYFRNLPNVAVGLLRFSYNTSGPVAGEPYKLGACFVVLVPILIVFIFFQKKLMSNLSAGGVKG